MFERRQNLPFEGRPVEERRFRNLKNGLHHPLGFDSPTAIIPLPMFDENDLTPTSKHIQDEVGERRVFGDWIRAYPRVRLTTPTQTCNWIPFVSNTEISPTNPVGLVLKWKKSSDPLLQKYFHLLDEGSRNALFRFDRERYFFFGVILSRDNKVLERPVGLDLPVLIDIPRTAVESIKLRAENQPLLPHEKMVILEFIPKRAGIEGLSRFDVEVKDLDAFCSYKGCNSAALKTALSRKIKEIYEKKVTWASLLEEYPEEAQFNDIIKCALPPPVLYRIFADTIWEEKLPESIRIVGKKISEEMQHSLNISRHQLLTEPEEVKDLSEEFGMLLDRDILKKEK